MVHCGGRGYPEASAKNFLRKVPQDNLLHLAVCVDASAQCVQALCQRPRTLR